MTDMTTLPSAPAFLLHWSGSEIAGLTVDGQTLTLRFSAAFGHQPGDGVAGYLRPVELVFQGAAWQGDEPALCRGGVVQGRLQVNGAPVGASVHALPVPGAATGAVACEFRLISGTALRIEAASVIARSGEGAQFHESFAC